MLCLGPITWTGGRWSTGVITWLCQWSLKIHAHNFRTSGRGGASYAILICYLGWEILMVNNHKNDRDLKKKRVVNSTSIKGLHPNYKFDRVSGCEAAKFIFGASG